ncbi:hypothetical protein [Bacillus rhizoplanae]|uniref:hypothetical protein n=1 Tax=Bacillus rhizoplanae TaxID=2880966 RepID=UPI003D1BE40E
MNCNHKNHGEMSLLWTVSILNQILSKETITFVGVDQDLYTYVEQCYFLVGNMMSCYKVITYNKVMLIH